MNVTQLAQFTRNLPWLKRREGWATLCGQRGQAELDELTPEEKIARGAMYLGQASFIESRYFTDRGKRRARPMELTADEKVSFRFGAELILAGLDELGEPE